MSALYRQCLLLVFAGIALASCRNPLKEHLNNKGIQNRFSPMLGSVGDFDNPRESRHKLFSLYDELRLAFANDDFSAIKPVTVSITAQLELLRKTDRSNAGELAAINQSLPGFEVVDTEAKRQAFGFFSEAVVALHKKTKGVEMDLYHCPMAKGYGYWLQPKGTTLSNPYMGLRMQKCGSLVEQN
ncbi:MAG: DUF3347 domain-containing protein [Deltaproteobacteria bacterium]|nr:DUF3347 domain-containing protein [Deltaproteobacteria bacterium]